MGFKAHSLQSTYRLYLSIAPIDACHMQLWVRWQPYCRYFQILFARPPTQCEKFRLWTSCMSLFWHLSFEMASRFLENVWTPATVCTCNSSIQKNLWRQDAGFCVMCWLTAVFKIFQTFNLPQLLKECYRMHFIMRCKIIVT